MKKKDLIKFGLNEVQADKIVEEYKKALKDSIPKARLDEVIAERNALRIYTEEQNKKILNLEQRIQKREEKNMTLLRLLME
ncbi:hypothetical protein [Candidatus Galacturonibacter soehngenii]|uniref:Uncharacterized protein n=1 Tax=Candidatus Galacturonatibacter soehngenii TaxID=2307010 RepID=A0A7V7QNA2_9FIRM|nr:hypothetical protein [Candidatus Galacturonibacter soehngenii]KAB1440153.1 hypothetical protein F7O84_07190 [Candidatus Galacturonibacter soehngenii]